MGTKSIEINVRMGEGEALAFAQFLKRVGVDDYLKLAEDKGEAWVMIEAGEKIRSALAEAGFAPR